MPALPSPDPTRCPLCGEVNRCAMELERETGQVQPPCWCMGATFTDSLRASVPLDARGLACICSSCTAKALAKETTS